MRFEIAVQHSSDHNRDGVWHAIEEHKVDLEADSKISAGQALLLITRFATITHGYVGRPTRITPLA